MSRVKLIQVKEGVLAENAEKAESMRERLRGKGTFLLNLMASPGAGKTHLILETIRVLGDQWRIGIIEADLDSSVDAERVAEPAWTPPWWTRALGPWARRTWI